MWKRTEKWTLRIQDRILEGRDNNTIGRESESKNYKGKQQCDFDDLIARTSGKNKDNLTRDVIDRAVQEVGRLVEGLMSVRGSAWAQSKAQTDPLLCVQPCPHLLQGD